MSGSTRRRISLLTARQRQVLVLAANGHTNMEIASRFGIAQRSVDSILTAAYRSLGVGDRAHAVSIALALGEIAMHEIHLTDQQRGAA